MEIRPASVDQRSAMSVGLTKGQKALGIGLLLFYLAMIVITIATLPYAVHDLADGIPF